MAERVKIRDNRLFINLAGLPAELRESILEETNRQSEVLTNYIQDRHLTGGTGPTKLKVRSGLMRTTTRAIESRSAERMKGGTRFGARYAGTHVGPKGVERIIKPRRAKALAIPIMNGLTEAGVPRESSPRKVPGLTLIKRKGKDPLLAKVVGGVISPWYVLKKEVKVRTRIHPDEVISANMPRILRDYDRVIEDTLRTKL